MAPARVVVSVLWFHSKGREDANQSGRSPTGKVCRKKVQENRLFGTGDDRIPAERHGGHFPGKTHVLAKGSAQFPENGLGFSGVGRNGTGTQIANAIFKG